MDGRQHLLPLQGIVQKWAKDMQDEQVSLQCFQQVTEILKRHYDTRLNATKTAFRDNSEEGQLAETSDLENLIDWVVQNVTKNVSNQQELKQYFTLQLLEYQRCLFKQNLDNVYSSIFGKKKPMPELSLDQEMKYMKVAQSEEHDIEKTDDEDEGQGDESDASMKEFVIEEERESDSDTDSEESDA